MIDLLALLLLLFALYYAGLMGAFAFGFWRVRRAPAPPAPAADAPPFVSVVIAARDEAATIGPCLASIFANDYPPDRFEVIVVDDFSSDATPAIVRRFQRHHRAVLAGVAAAPDEDEARLRLLRMRDHARAAAGHKQQALACGLAAARGTLLLTTDADCEVPPRWIRMMAGAFAERTAFVAGPVLYRPGRTVFGHLQALEFLGLIAVGAGGIGIGRPNMCNSANVAYRRSVYEQLRETAPHEAGPGEDEVLLQRIAAETDWDVAFCATAAAAVRTVPVRGLRAFVAQRRRWAGTGARYPSRRLVAAIAAVYAFSVLLLGAGLAAPFVSGLWGPLALASGFKVASEAALLLPACRRYGPAWLFAYFLPEQLLQIPYVVFIGAAGVLGGTHWKGRRLNG
jgi:cellulose synthase/poly-beta-1,6-N-acetylglucosamine synthase-like glycosyltransferase